jgi:hypothetical protein
MTIRTKSKTNTGAEIFVPLNKLKKSPEACAEGATHRGRHRHVICPL